MSRTCDVMCAIDHVINLRPSPFIFANWKQSRTGGKKAWKQGNVFLVA